MTETAQLELERWLRVYCSCRGPEFSSHHPRQVAYNCLYSSSSGFDTTGLYRYPHSTRTDFPHRQQHAHIRITLKFLMKKYLKKAAKPCDFICCSVNPALVERHRHAHLCFWHSSRSMLGLRKTLQGVQER